VVLFPGQGSQRSDMEDAVIRWAPELHAAVLEIVGADVFGRVEESTRFLQPALFCASVAGWRQLEPRVGGDEVGAFAGHSLGEFAALVAAGALSPIDGLHLVALRGRLMERAAGEGPPGGMVALIGREPAYMAMLASKFGVTLANDNANDQAVLSGPQASLDEAVEEAVRLGLRCRRLHVSGAFHSPAMEPVVAEFRAALDAAEWHPPAAPVWSSCTAAPFDEQPAEVLAAALTQGVRWRELTERLAAAGFDRFVEAGPGKVLSRLVPRTVPDVTAASLQDLFARA
jgi:malonyl CoA-acyl carrier protein transacylase